MRSFIISVLSLILTSAVYADAASLTDHRAMAILQSDITSFDSSIVALEFSDAGDVAVLVMEFRATLSTPEGMVNNGGSILVVLRELEGAWTVLAESVSAGPVSALSNLKLY